MEGLEFDRIGDVGRVWLERKFERDEILQVVRDLEGDKSSRSGWVYYGILSSVLESSGERRLSGL